MAGYAIPFPTHTISCSYELFSLKVSVCDLDMAEGEHMVRQLSVKYGKDKILFCQCDVTDYPQFEGITLFLMS